MMSQVAVIQTTPPSISVSYPATTNTAASTKDTHIQSFSYPVHVMQDRVRIYGELMVKNTFYPFVYKGKRYALYRPADKVTEIYEVVE